MMAWVTQGALTDRTTERLGTSDQGIILFRQLLLDELEKVERGEDPMGVVRDPARNTMIVLPREEHFGFQRSQEYDYVSLQFAARDLRPSGQQ
jgi:5,5'-dehydrodivanillate O-demethylase